MTGLAMSRLRGAHNSAQGMTLWGPVTQAGVSRRLPTSAHRAQDIATYAARRTYLASEFFDTMPDLYELIGEVSANVRLLRGSDDEYNTLGDLRELARIHRDAQPARTVVTAELSGLPHVVDDGTLDAPMLAEYLHQIFPPAPLLPIA